MRRPETAAANSARIAGSRRRWRTSPTVARALRGPSTPASTPLLVPPWNRIDPRVIARLPAAGYVALSTFGPRPAPWAAPGVVQCNTHVDLIAWRQDRAFIGADRAIERTVAHLRARREGHVDSVEPTGILTHHLDFDDAAWAFLGGADGPHARRTVRRAGSMFPR